MPGFKRTRITDEDARDLCRKILIARNEAGFLIPLEDRRELDDLLFECFCFIAEHSKKYSGMNCDQFCNFAISLREEK